MLARRYCIVPSGVNLVSAQPYIFEFFIGDFDSDLVLIRVQQRFDLEPGSRLGASDEIDDCFVIDQRLSFQFRLINEKSRCSILFHLLVPGG